MSVLIPQPVIAEVRHGLARLPRSRRRNRLESRFEDVLGAIDRAPWTDDVSRIFGETKSRLEREGRRIDDFDLAIAAHALAIDAILATSNLRHLSRVQGLDLEDWNVPPVPP